MSNNAIDMFNMPGNEMTKGIEGKNDRSTASLACDEQHLPLAPDPEVHHQERDRHQQEAPRWVSRGRLGTGLMHNPIARFDAKTVAILFGDLEHGAGAGPKNREKEILYAMLLGPSFLVPTRDPQGKGDRALLATGHGVLRTRALFPLLQRFERVTLLG